MLRTAHWDFPRTAQELAFQMKHSFIRFPLKPFSGHTRKVSKLTSSFAWSKRLNLKNTAIKTPSKFSLRKSSTLKILAPFWGELRDLIRPTLGLGSWFHQHYRLLPIDIIDLSNHFCWRQRNVTDPQVVPCFHHNSFSTCCPPILKRSCQLRVSSSSLAILTFAYVHRLGLLFQSPVVRSERSQTDELLRFAFATTCRFTKSLTRTCQRFFRSAYGRSFNLPLIQATTATGRFCWRGFHPLEFWLASLLSNMQMNLASSVPSAKWCSLDVSSIWITMHTGTWDNLVVCSWQIVSKIFCRIVFSNKCVRARNFLSKAMFSGCFCRDLKWSLYPRPQWLGVQPLLSTKKIPGLQPGIFQVETYK